MSGITRHIPNTITSLNLICGSLGVICAFEGRLDYSFILMLAAAVCDFCDGLCARLLNAYSAVGKELDSLADLVSFGLLPAMMFHVAVSDAGAEGFLSWIPLAIVVFSALRLAKFNVDESQTENFLGLATPACAMIIGSFFYYTANSPDSMMAAWIGKPVFIILSSAILSALMVSRIPTFSTKKLKIPTCMFVPIMLVVVLFASFVISQPWLTLGISTLCYAASIPVGIVVFWNEKRKYEN